MGGNCIDAQHFENQKLLNVNQVLMTKHFENSCKFMIVYVNLSFNTILVFSSYSPFLLRIERSLLTVIVLI